MRLVPLVGCLALSTSCATFSERPPEPDYAGPEEPVAIRLTRSGEAKLYVAGGWLGIPNPAGLDREGAKAIWQSGWVRSGDESESADELSLYVADYQGPGPSLLTVLTAFLLPGVIDHRIELRLTRVSPEGGETTCTRSIDVRTWYQTFLIVVYPFRSPAHNRAKSTEVLARQCLAEVLDGT